MVYALARPSLPDRGWFSGLVFGGWLVAAFLGLLIAGETRDFQLFGPFAVATGFFAGIFLMFGVGLGYLTGRAADAIPPVPTWRKATTHALLGATALFGLTVLIHEVLQRI